MWRNSWLSGSETFVRDQADALQRWEALRVGLRRLEPALVAPELSFLGPSRAAELRIELIGSLGLRRRAAAYLGARGARLVHAHFGLDAISASPVAARVGVPLLVTCHGYDVTLLPRKPAPLGPEYRRRLRRVFDTAGGLVAVSGFVRDRMVALGAPPGTVRVLPVGIDTLGVHADDPVPAGRHGVIFVGRLVAKKGPLELLRTWAALPAELRTRHPLRIVGEGPLRRELADRAAAVDGPVEILGPRTSAEVADLLARSAVYAQPSHTAPDGDAEGFGMVFLEAALQGLPSVAYAHGGVPDAVVDGATGLLAPEGDAAGLRSRLERLLREPDLAARLGASGRARVVREFDIRDRTSDLERFYDEVAGSPGAGGAAGSSPDSPRS